jgi:hypothetical protein
MADLHSDSLQLLIRCPNCAQRFKVGEDFRDRTVECGACDHRFRINDEVIVRGKKFYPGERRDARLDRFNRVPLAVAPPIVGAKAVRYSDAPDPLFYEPTPPLRIIAGIISVCFMVMMALLLIFGGKTGGMLDGMVTSNRLFMAGFTSLLGILLLVYANPRARAKATSVGIAMSAVLIALPFFFTAGSVPLVSTLPTVPQVEEPSAGSVTDTENSKPGESEEMAELRKRIDTEPLELENTRLQLAGSTQRAIGVWLRDMREHNRYIIEDYVVQAAGASDESHFFPRGKGDYLFRVTGLNMSIEEFANLLAPIGKVERIIPELDVIEVKVVNENFIEGPLDKLTDRSSPDFYVLNKRELDSIDLQRVENAVKRLAEVEPVVYRSDITDRLIKLLAMPDLKFKDDICRALGVWSQTPGLASDTALREIKLMMDDAVSIPEEMVELVLKEKNPGLLPVMHQLWEENPTLWESLYAELGPLAEKPLLSRFPTADGIHRYSVVRLLGKVGSKDSLTVLEAAMSEANSELRVLLEKSANSIRERSAD